MPKTQLPELGYSKPEVVGEFTTVIPCKTRERGRGIREDRRRVKVEWNLKP